MRAELLTEVGEAVTEVIDGDAYMDVLLRRQAAWREAHTVDGSTPRLLPLLEWFIRDADVPFVRLPEPPAKRTPAPRRYRSAESLRSELAAVEARMAAVAGRDDTGDPAVVNLSPRARSRAVASAGRRRFAAMDRDLQTYAKLTRRRDALAYRVRQAERREGPVPFESDKTASEETP